MDAHDRMAELLQEFVSENNTHLVGPFLVIMEADIPESPEDFAYHVIRKGSPATQIGMAEYLRSYLDAIVFQEE